MSEQASNTSPTVSAFYDPASWCWRTCQGSLLSEAPPSLQHLPPCATTVDGWLYEQATPEHLTAARDGSVLPNLPTPRAQHGEPRNMQPWLRPLDEPPNLENALARLPGPATRLRSNHGNESSDDEHPTRPMIEDCDPSLSSG